MGNWFPCDTGATDLKGGKQIDLCPGVLTCCKFEETVFCSIHSEKPLLWRTRAVMILSKHSAFQKGVWLKSSSDWWLINSRFLCLFSSNFFSVAPIFSKYVTFRWTTQQLCHWQDCCVVHLNVNAVQLFVLCESRDCILYCKEFQRVETTFLLSPHPYNWPPSL